MISTVAKEVLGHKIDRGFTHIRKELGLTEKL